MVLPHIALVLFIVAYCLFGAYVFYILERPSEEHRKLTGRKFLLDNISETVTFLENYSEKKERVIYDDNEKQLVTPVQEKVLDLLKTYERLSAKYSVNVDDLKNENTHWSYASSILFSFTVITTIGKEYLIILKIKIKNKKQLPCM